MAARQPRRVVRPRGGGLGGLGFLLPRSWFVASLLRCGRVPWACPWGRRSSTAWRHGCRARHPGPLQRRRSSRLASAADAEPSSSAHAAAAARTRSMRRLRPAPKERAPFAHPTHLVRPGETLWSIADSRSGDGADWTSIAALNLGTQMPGGVRFVDPDHLRAGWRLRLPPDSRRAPHDHAGGRAARQRSPAGTHGIGTGIRRLCSIGEASQASAGSNRLSGAPWRPVSDRRGGHGHAPRSLRGRPRARSLRGGEPHARPCGARSGRTRRRGSEPCAWVRRG